VKADDRVQQTLDALVEEAYQLAITRGLAITNPDGWRAWKRSVYVETAKREGAGYLRGHHRRLGLGNAYPPRPSCAKCATPIAGNPYQKTDDDPTPFCSYECAGVRTMTLREWIAQATPEQADAFRRVGISITEETA
jgi:endogenous inhibitor of DNA gyrase (YacG/DUF329 family)